MADARDSVKGRTRQRLSGDAIVLVSHLGETKVKNFDVTTTSDEKIPGLYVAMDDALSVGGVEAVGDLNSQIE